MITRRSILHLISTATLVSALPPLARQLPQPQPQPQPRPALLLGDLTFSPCLAESVKLNILLLRTFGLLPGPYTCCYRVSLAFGNTLHSVAVDVESLAPLLALYWSGRFACIPRGW